MKLVSDSGARRGWRGCGGGVGRRGRFASPQAIVEGLRKLFARHVRRGWRFII